MAAVLDGVLSVSYRPRDMTRSACDVMSYSSGCGGYWNRNSGMHGPLLTHLKELAHSTI